jgi:copper resistance protein C
MKHLTSMTATVLLTVAGTAQAHTHLMDSVPAAASTVTAAPKEIVLTFGESVRLTALTLQKDSGKEQMLTPLPKGAATKISVPAPKLENGKYTVNWRVIGNDGHIMTGKIQFSIGPVAVKGPAGATHQGH